MNRVEKILELYDDKYVKLDIENHERSGVVDEKLKIKAFLKKHLEEMYERGKSDRQNEVIDFLARLNNLNT